MQNPSNLFLSSFPAGCSRGLCSISCPLPQLRKYWPSTEPGPALCVPGLSFSSAAAVSRVKRSNLSLAGVQKKKRWAAWRGQSRAGFMPVMATGFFCLLLDIRKKKREVLRQAAVPGWGRGTEELGSFAMFGVCSQRNSPTPSECNCRDKVGVA